MDTLLKEQEEIAKKIEDVFSAVIEGKSVKALISSDRKVLNPFSTLYITFQVGDERISVEALLKCDTIGNCKYCFTRDFSHIVLIKGRVEKIIDTQWVGVLNWDGTPIFEDSYYNSMKITSGLLIGEYKEEGYERITVYRYSSLSIEKKGSLYMVSILEKDKIIRYFTEELRWEI